MARLINRGDIRWYRFAAPDKRRPVLILTRDSAIDYLAELTIAPITSTIRDIPSEVMLTPADGMPRDCAINLDHLQTVSKSRIGPILTRLHSVKLAEVRKALTFALDFSHE
ncbi:MAG: type II toxin-antitoxin system PemK/MazF family toxin [Planctomycetota bacterium]